MTRLLGRIAVAAALLLAPAAAHAGDGDRLGTPMKHLGERCMTVVDRSVDPVVHLEWTIPFTDTCLTADELPGSRTHQLVAFCRGDPPARKLPIWHTRAEAEAVTDLPVAGPVPASEILDEHPDYAGCWSPIFPADERRAITCAAARPGADWDTTGLPAGAYVVRGYTFDPPLNAWSPRRGIFKIVDGPDPADAAPAVGFAADGDLYLWRNQPLAVRLCVDAMPGSAVSLAYALSEADPTWTDFVVDEPVTGADMTLEFLPPDALAGKLIALRAEIRDPQDRRFVAFLQSEVKVETVEDPNPPATTDSDDTTTAGDDTTGPMFDFCADNPAADDPPDCPPVTGTTTGDDPQAPGGGCNCIHAAPSPPALLVLLALRRRRATVA